MDSGQSLSISKIKQVLPLVSLATAAAIEALYLPSFKVGQFAELIYYLQFRAELFLMLFCLVGITTILIIALTKQPNWFVAIFGISLCMVALNMVYLVSALPSSSLNRLFYMETEDNPFYYVPSSYAWLAILIGVIVCLIGVTQGLVLCRSYSTRQKIISTIVDGGMLGAIAVLPLPIYVYFFDRGDFTNHVTMNLLPTFTNADLLFSSALTVVVCLILKWTLK